MKPILQLLGPSMESECSAVYFHFKNIILLIFICFVSSYVISMGKYKQWKFSVQSTYTTFSYTEEKCLNPNYFVVNSITTYHKQSLLTSIKSLTYCVEGETSPDSAGLGRQLVTLH